MEMREFAMRGRINANVLDKWVEAGWLIPDEIDTRRRYSEVDLARAHLIRDLLDLGVNDEGIHPRSYRPDLRITAYAARASVDD